MNRPRVLTEKVVEFLRQNMTASNAQVIAALSCSPKTVTEARRVLGMMPQNEDQDVSDAVDEAQEMVQSGECDLVSAVKSMSEKYALCTNQRYKLRKNLTARVAKMKQDIGSCAGSRSLVNEMMGGEAGRDLMRRAWR